MTNQEKEVKKIMKLLKNMEDNGIKIVLGENALIFYDLQEYEEHFEKYDFIDSSHDSELEEIDSFSIATN